MKIISIDLDGTLLNSRGEINDILANYLIELQLKGHIVIINTGRNQSSSKNAIAKLKLIENKNYFIGVNGQFINDFKNNIIFEYPRLSLDNVNKIINIAKKNNIMCNIILENTTYLVSSKRLLPFSILINFIRKRHWISRQNDNFIQKHIINIKNHINDDIPKICFSSTPKNLKRFSEILKKEYPNLNLFFVNEIWLEAVNSGISKGTALKKISEELNISPNNIICFGDGENDISMLKFANISVAMKNSNKNVKHSANFTCDTNDNNGIYKFLIEYFKES